MSSAYIAKTEHLNSYRSVLDRKLKTIVFPHCTLVCANKQCKDTRYIENIQLYYDAIVNCCYTAGVECIPSVNKSRGRERMPGWSEHVKGYKRSAMFWHGLWKCNGSPQQGWLADIRRLTRKKYHDAINKVKRENDKIVS